MRKALNALLLAVVFSAFVTGCTRVNMVPKADLDAANYKVAILEDENEQLQGKLENANNELQEMSYALGAYESLLCEQSWQQLTEEVDRNKPVTEADNVDVVLFMDYIKDTQGQASGEPQSVFLVDAWNTRSMALDFAKDCIIVNPEYSPVGK
jgi:hypothetical protein